MRSLFFFFVCLSVGSLAFADYDDLARQRDAREAADRRVSDFARVRRWNDSMNRQIVGQMTSFARQHRGLASAPEYSYSEYGDYGTDVKVQDHIHLIKFSTLDAYECRVDWGDLYDGAVHLRLNCINRVSGKSIDLYPRTK